MPPKSKLLPYLRRTRSGRLEYYRRIPVELRPHLGNKAAITRVLACDSSKPGAKAVQTAWAAVHAEVEAQIEAAQAALAPISKPLPQVTALSPRDVAGIAAEPWRNLLEAGDTGQNLADVEQLLAQVVAIARHGMTSTVQIGDAAPAQQAKADVTELLLGNVLSQLQISPDPQALAQIQQRLIGYLPMVAGDLEKRQAGDYSTADIESKPPPLPTSRATFDMLLDRWLIEAGGVRESDGIGISQDRIKKYNYVIRLIKEHSGKQFPSDLNVADARAFVAHLQQQEGSPTTKQNKLQTLNNLMRIGLRTGLISTNPFEGMQLKIPKGATVNSYRSFTDDELIKIFDYLNTLGNNERSMLVTALLMTGARCADLSYLRHTDVKKNADGIYYFDFVDDPDGTFPHSLKGGTSDERHTPLHPSLIERGFLKLVDASAEGYVFSCQNTDVISAWFRRLLTKLNLYEKGVALHGMRGTCIDAMRKARLPMDVRRAMTAHSSRDVQDRTYGEGLQNMESVLFKEISQVDWSWLP